MTIKSNTLHDKIMRLKCASFYDLHTFTFLSLIILLLFYCSKAASISNRKVIIFDRFSICINSFDSVDNKIDSGFYSKTVRANMKCVQYEKKKIIFVDCRSSQDYSTKLKVDLNKISKLEINNAHRVSN